MIDAPTQALLQNLIRREGRSLLQYVHESYPWTTPGGQEVLAQFDQLVTEERDAITALSRLLARRRVAPSYLGPYPMNFTTINFVSLTYLLPLLADHQQHSLSALEKDLSQIGDAEVRAQVRDILDMKRRHLHTLQTMAASPGIADCRLQIAD